LVENVAVKEHIVSLIPYLKKYIASRVVDECFEAVRTAFKDTLLDATRGLSFQPTPSNFTRTHV